MAMLLHDKLKLQLAEIIEESIQKAYPDIDNKPNINELYNSLSSTPNPKMGQIAFACFPLAKAFRGNPAQIATNLLENLGKNPLVDKAITAGPYLNFFINTKSLASEVIPAIYSGELFKRQITENSPKTIIEFSQPNTHKEMHVGHMRNLCLGDSIIKLHRYCGYPTISTTFPGDVGTHVAKCLWYYTEHNKETPPKIRKGAWLGTLYTKANNLLEDQKGTDKEEENRAILTKILKELESKSGKYFDMWVETRQWSIDLMNDVYSWANVEFDSWYWESDVDSESVKLIKEYQTKGLFKEDQGAVGIDLSDEKLGFCILLKSDGTGLYATKDIELARRKFEDHNVEKSIYVVDNRQSHHFKQVFNILGKMGFENSKNCYHLQYEMVELTDGAMSSRKGNVVALQSLIDKMVETIKTNFLARYKDEWSKDEIDKTANIVASGAIKYGMTRVDSTKKIIFDMNEWLKLDGESGPYIQYVHARINSMINKLGIVESADFSNLTTDIESQIVLKLANFNTVVSASCEDYKTHFLCAYLYELSKLFNSFYSECPVGKAEEGVKEARIMLCQAVAITLVLKLQKKCNLNCKIF
jgi:arginyl-tRNA synthetase